MVSFIVCLCSFLLGAAVSAPIGRSPFERSLAWKHATDNEGDIFSDDLCQPVPAEIVASANLTAEESSVLWLVCWNRVVTFDDRPLENGLRRGIPDDVECDRTTWCDDVGVCSEVCSPGTVVISPWLRNAIKSQTSMARTLPLCYAQFLGTHNSAITLANGYGNRDDYFTKLLSLSSLTSAAIETNNQWFSLTDQLNMGARMLELDVHWVKSHLRIAHCGGLHSSVLDDIIKAINVISRLLGKSSIMWDTETFGCSPSLSSIAADDQRLFVDAISEIHAWLWQAENLDEFIIIYLDSQLDLLNWDKLDDLLAEVLAVFPRHVIFTPEDKAKFFDREWPTANQLVANGKRVMFVNRQSFNEDLHRYFFRAGDDGMCGWSEAEVRECFLDRHFQTCQPAMNGTLVRVETCELTYGPLNCEMEFGRNEIPLNKGTLPKILNCGINFPSPDRLTPQRAAAAIWSWASGEPQTTPGARENECAFISADDGRWKAGLCSRINQTPVSCWKTAHNRSNWSVGFEGVCLDGSKPGSPRHAKENEKLHQLLKETGLESMALGGEVAGLLGTEAVVEQ
ncbi:hypothetical protein BSKO_06630 [Bryopsis sp. KO-2023]|nr:hypothetical protein BSKO_06630 [Bryopsis sp. KO-2023]